MTSLFLKINEAYYVEKFWRSSVIFGYIYLAQVNMYQVKKEKKRLLTYKDIFKGYNDILHYIL